MREKNDIDKKRRELKMLLAVREALISRIASLEAEKRAMEKVIEFMEDWLKESV